MTISDFLQALLRSDAPWWVPSIRKTVWPYVKRKAANKYSDVAPAKKAMMSGDVEPGQWIQLDCKPSMFATFSRFHAIPFVMGQRKGPGIVGDNEVIAVLGNAMSHLEPVGLYPPMGDGAFQLTLYPRDSICFGLRTPQVLGNLLGSLDTPKITAIAASRNSVYLDRACRVNGIAQALDIETFVAHFGSAEQWASLKQSGDIWYIDLRHDDASVVPLEDVEPTEMWGAIYMSGHLEFKGQIEVKDVAESMVAAIEIAGSKAQVMTDLTGKTQEIYVQSNGLRALVRENVPFYSLHMDAEMTSEFAISRAAFDKVTRSFLDNILASKSGNLADITNPHEVDVTYTDSAAAYSVLTSQAAEAINDPVAVAIRNWHRQRSSAAKN